MLKVSKTKDGQESVWFFCVPCDTHHRFIIKRGSESGPNSPVWGWDHNLEKPTFTPSLLVTYHYKEEPRRCHLYLRKGIVEYLPDCTHSHAGKKVPVTPPSFM